MATVYVIWSRAEKKLVPSDDANYSSSQLATDAARRLKAHAGNAKDIEGRVYDVVSMTV